MATKPNAIVRIYHPDITPEERARRMELIRRAAADLVRDTMKRSMLSAHS